MITKHMLYCAGAGAALVVLGTLSQPAAAQYSQYPGNGGQFAQPGFQPRGYPQQGGPGSYRHDDDDDRRRGSDERRGDEERRRDLSEQRQQEDYQRARNAQDVAREQQYNQSILSLQQQHNQQLLSLQEQFNRGQISRGQLGAGTQALQQQYEAQSAQQQRALGR